MAIGDFTRIAQQPLQNAVVGQDKQGRIELQEPLKAPSKWTRFKAALSNVPLLGQIGTLQKARASVADYPVKLENYQATNRQILEGFVADLQSRFGADVANMALREARPQDGAPLSQRAVATIIEHAEKSEKHHKAMTNMDLSRFIDSPLAAGSRLPGEMDMTTVFLDMGHDIPAHCSSWQEAIGPDRAKIVEGRIMQAIQDHPDYGKRCLSNHQIAAAAERALRASFAEFSSDPAKDMSAASVSDTELDSNEMEKIFAELESWDSPVTTSSVNSDADSELVVMSDDGPVAPVSDQDLDAGETDALTSDPQKEFERKLDDMIAELSSVSITEQSVGSDTNDALEEELDAILAAANQRPKR